MSFCVSYERLNNRNIKHLYSIKEFVPDVRRSQRIYNPALLSYNLSQERKVAWMKKRLYEYDEEYDINVPRAPAFRSVSAQHVEDIVRRLTRPSTIKTKPRSCRHYRLGFKKYLKDDEGGPHEGQVKSAREIKDIVERLSKPRVCDRRHYYMYHSMPELPIRNENGVGLPSVSD